MEGRFASFGAVAAVVGEVTLPDGTRGVAVEAVHRAELGPAVGHGRRAARQRERAARPGRPGPPRRSAWRASTARSWREVADLRGDRARVAHFLSSITHPGRLADTAGYAPEIPLASKLELLETVDVVERLRLAIAAQRERLADASLRQRIREDVAEGLDQTQREMLLRRQLAAIRKELGEGEDDGDDEWATRIAESGMPEAAGRRPSASSAGLQRQPEGPRRG